MGETEGDAVVGEQRPSEDRDAASSQDGLQVPGQKKLKTKSPTPGGLRGRSSTPMRGRSSTPFSTYIAQRSTTPSAWRSITPFLKRDDKEKTPFELGRDIKTQIISNYAVLDKALVMDISVPEDLQKPVRYITSDLSVLDRASVMDVSNVEVIYVVEEYEEEIEEPVEEVVEEVKPKKKPARVKKDRTPQKSAEVEKSPTPVLSETEEAPKATSSERESSFDFDEPEDSTKKGKKKSGKKKKEKSPSPKLSLSLEIGGGQKASKKMFEQQNQQKSRPPPKKSKMALELEAKAKAEAKAAAEEARKKAEREEKERKRKEEEERIRREEEEAAAAAAAAAAEAEALALAEAEAAAAAAAAAEAEGEEYYGEGYEGGGDVVGDLTEGYYNEEGEWVWNEGHGEAAVVVDEAEAAEEEPEMEEQPDEKRRGSDSSEDFVRPDPEEEARWKKIPEDNPETEMVSSRSRRHSEVRFLSERERDADWQRRREMSRLPQFSSYLNDRSVPAGNNVRLSCAVAGPELSVKWYKNGDPVQRDNYHRITNNNNVLALEIISATEADAGEYKCVISNMNDEVSSSCKVNVYELFKQAPEMPTFKFIREYYNLRDDELTIECHVQGVPRPKISWWRGIFEVTPSYKFIMLEEAHGVCKLVIYKPSTKENDVYTCKAVNSSGEAQTSHTVEFGKNVTHHVPGIFHARDRIQRDKELTAKKAMAEALQSKADSERKRAEAEEEAKLRKALRAAEPTVQQKNRLRFCTQLRDRVALEGTNIRLVCTIIGPYATCRWMKDDKWIVANKNVKITNVDGKTVLEMSNVTEETSGFYKCIAKNRYCETDTSCIVKVYPPQIDGDEQEPMFVLPLRDVYQASVNDLVIDTKVRGNPRPMIMWEKDDLPIALDDRIVQIDHLDGLSELIINKPMPEDAGMYICTAENKLGSQKISHEVVASSYAVSRRSSLVSYMMEYGDDRRGSDADSEHPYERRVRPLDPTPKQQLYFTVFLLHRYVAQGSTVKLQAVVGGPSPSFRWKKDGQYITYGSHYRNKNRENLAMIEIVNCEPEDSGEYSVIAQNDVSTITTTATLSVYETTLNTDIEPVFIRALKDTYHTNSHELVLETCVRGQPTPTITWYKDNLEIERSGRITIMEHADGSCELSIDRPNYWDSGKYVVKAVNRKGQAEILHKVAIAPEPYRLPSPPKLLAKSPYPSSENLRGENEEGQISRREAAQPPDLRKHIYFLNFLSNRTVKAGTNINWMVSIGGPNPSCRWYKDGEQLVPGGRIKTSCADGIARLMIKAVTEADAGQYTLRVQGDENEIESSCTLFVYSTDKADATIPTFSVGIKDNYSLNEDELMLDCRVRGNPRPEMQWLKGSEPIQIGGRYSQIDLADGYSKLIISKPTEKDSGRYSCIAQNSAGDVKSTHHVDFVGPERFTIEKAHGFFHRDLKKPRFAMPLGDQTVCEGGTIAISTEFMECSEPIDVRWFLGRQPLIGQPNVKAFMDKGVYTLAITKATLAHEGTYTCRASTAYGRCESHTTVDVTSIECEERPPLFQTRPDHEMKIAFNDPFSISFSITGDPKPKLTLIKGTRDITKSERVFKEVSDKFTRFTIQRSQISDSGTYFVVARNNFGTDRIFVSVTIKCPKRRE